MNNSHLLVYPGVKVGENQNYTITYNYQTVFLTHREDFDEIMFGSNDLTDYEKLDIIILFREYLTNEN